VWLIVNCNISSAGLSLVGGKWKEAWIRALAGAAPSTNTDIFHPFAFVVTMESLLLSRILVHSRNQGLKWLWRLLHVTLF